MPDKTKHLDYIQGIVNRMADNSFKLKGYSVSLVTGLFALSAAVREQFVMVSIAFVPVVIFWILDGYFLWQERLFRKEYDRVRKLKDEEIDYGINPIQHKGKRNRWISSVFSKTLMIFYGMLMAVIAGVMVWLVGAGG